MTPLLMNQINAALCRRAEDILRQFPAGGDVPLHAEVSNELAAILQAAATYDLSNDIREINNHIQERGFS